MAKTNNKDLARAYAKVPFGDRVRATGRGYNCLFLGTDFYSYLTLVATRWPATPPLDRPLLLVLSDAATNTTKRHIHSVVTACFADQPYYCISVPHPDHPGFHDNFNHIAGEAKTSLAAALGKLQFRSARIRDLLLAEAHMRDYLTLVNCVHSSTPFPSLVAREAETFQRILDGNLTDGDLEGDLPRRLMKLRGIMALEATA